MAYYIETSARQKFTWYIQHRKPTILYDNIKVIFFQADGDELEKIRTLFFTLPITKGNICTWRNESAQLVYDNL